MWNFTIVCGIKLNIKLAKKLQLQLNIFPTGTGTYKNLSSSQCDGDGCNQ